MLFDICLILTVLFSVLESEKSLITRLNKYFLRQSLLLFYSYISMIKAVNYADKMNCSPWFLRFGAPHPGLPYG